ncbi:ShlB/FhaC/HecB family hemolysin secretion/activation protein [Sphingorhabdus contaminans]|uniref:ShlB/FhaC/HecB family hemolysin secretion/activation protein n=1 Tax=Sphingorhabdus contaminans TaxID=1343899 RepID=UPI0014777446|nr:ShlB/FhaC/HecB family hemolysin secretion/activation protein [Sphingorhabdus contaminans]
MPAATKDDTPNRNEVNVEAPQLVRSEAAVVPPESLPDNSGEGIRIGSVLIETDDSVNHNIFEKVIEPYLGSNASGEDLAKLAQKIAEIARSEGMVLANAYVPEQQIELGIVRIKLDAGSIDKVRIEGSANKALHRLLEPLVGKLVLKHELERRLMLANNIPEIVVKQTELINENGARVLIVRVQQRKKTSGQIVVDNFGSNKIGPLRARLSVEAVALFEDSDSLNVTFRTNPAEPQELLAASVVYGVGLGTNGTRAEVATAWSDSNIDPSSGFGKRNAGSRYASLAVNHPVYRSRNANLWADGQIEYLKVDQDSFGAVLQSDTVVTLSVGLSSSYRLGEGWLRTGTQLRKGLGIFGANGPLDPFSSRADADGTFTLARAWVNWSGYAVGNMTLRMAVSGQYSADPLLSSEEMGLGGAYTGRAFDFYERSGDNGILALAELGYEHSNSKSWIRRLQPYVFVDGGYVGNFRDGYGSGTLVSAGTGIRAGLGIFDLQVEAAAPVYTSGAIYSSDDPRVNVQLGLDF